ncbi:MAG: 50S ribosomal protein L23 [Candidatus Nanohaloarchaea archaeon]
MKTEEAWNIIENPHLTEQAMDKVDDNNTIVLIVDVNANKNQVEDAVEQLFEVTVKKVNTTITPQAKKKAFVRLSESDDAMDVATQMGMM